MDVASYRQRLGLSQTQLAEAMGVSPGHIGDLERRPPRRRLTVKLAARLESLLAKQGHACDVVAEVVAEERGAA